MEKGIFVIVLFANDESAQDVETWHSSDLKQYKLGVSGYNEQRDEEIY